MMGSTERTITKGDTQSFLFLSAQRAWKLGNLPLQCSKKNGHNTVPLGLLELIGARCPNTV